MSEVELNLMMRLGKHGRETPFCQLVAWLTYVLDRELETAGSTTTVKQIGNQTTTSANIFTAAPCISLNLYGHGQRASLRVFSFLGILIQCAVLLWDAYATYIKQYNKGASKVVNYSFPITCAGTVTLVAGMLICSWMVERSTYETIYRTKDLESVLHILWLQRACTVSDQVFNPHAIFANGTRSLVAISRRRHVGGAGPVENEDPSDKELCTGLWDGVLTTVGVLFSLIGFVAQFIGLWSMHWSASLTQFGATLVMAGLRAWVRGVPSAQPYAIELLPDHELDWLAARASDEESLGKLWIPPSPAPRKTERFKSFFRRATQQQPASPSCGSDQTFWTTGCRGWVIQTGGVMVDYTVLGERPCAEQKILETRIRLGRLTTWPSRAVHIAISVAAAIDLVMESRYPKPLTDGAVVQWFMHAHDGEAIRFSIKYCGGAWTSNLAEIDSALSLWLFSVHQKEKDDSDKVTEDKSTWLRTNVVGKRNALRLLGPVSLALRRDIKWWISGGVDQVLEVEGPTYPKHAEPRERGVLTFETHRVVGPAEWKRKYSGDPPRYQSVNIVNDTKTSQYPTFAVQSGVPLPQLYGQEIFSAFLWTTAPKFKSFVGFKAPDARNTQGKLFTLESEHLSQLAKGIQDTGLGSLQDVVMLLVPPLSFHRKLDNSVVGDLAIEKAREYELKRQWKMAANCLFRALPFALHFPLPPLQKIRGARVIGAILGLQARISYTVLFQQKLLLPGPGLIFTRTVPNEELQEIQNETIELLGRFVAGATLSEFARLYGSQARATTKVEIGDTKWWPGSCGTIPNIIPSLQLADGQTMDFLGWTEAHFAVMREEWDSTLRIQKERPQLFSHDLAGWTPFHYCFSVNRPASHRQLSEITSKMNSKNLECRTHAGLTVLHCAATKAPKGIFEELVRRYIRVGVDLDIQDNRGMTALHWATINGRHDLVSILLQGHASPKIRQENGFTPLHCIAFSFHKTPNLTINELLLHGANKDAIDDSNRTVLYLAVALDNPIVVEALLNGNLKKKDIEWKSQLVNISATRGPKDQILKLLLERQLHKKNNTRPTPGGLPLHLAIMCEDWETVDILVKQDIDPNEMSENGLTTHSLCSGYNFHPSRLGPRFNLNATDLKGKSYLHHAVESGRIYNVERLIEAGIDLGLKDISGQTAHDLIIGAGMRDIFSRTTAKANRTEIGIKRYRGSFESEGSSGILAPTVKTKQTDKEIVLYADSPEPKNDAGTLPTKRQIKPIKKNKLQAGTPSIAVPSGSNPDMYREHQNEGH